jgi:hypothetical protein
MKFLSVAAIASILSVVAAAPVAEADRKYITTPSITAT